MITQEQIDRTIQARIDREFAQAAAELNARTKPKAQPAPKPKPAPKARAKRVTASALDACARARMERRLDRLERATITTWGEALAHIAKRDGVGMAEAGKRAAREFPGLHPARRAK